MKLREMYGDVFRYWNGPNCFIVFNKFEQVVHILSSRNMTKYDRTETDLHVFRPFQPNGLEAVQGDKHKIFKRLLHPLVRNSNMTHHVEETVKRIDEWLLLLRERNASDNSIIHTDLVEQLAILAFQLVIGQFCADYNLKIMGKNEEEVKRANNIYIAMRDIANHAAFIGRYSIPERIAYIYLKMSSTFRRAVRIMRPIVKDITDYLICIQEENNNSSHINDSQLSKTLKDVASITVDQSNMIKDNSREKTVTISREIMEDWILSSFGGAYDSSSAYAWFIYYMSKYPHVQTSIKHELSEHNITRYTVLNSDLIGKLTYIDCVLKEVLRHAPLIETVQRQVVEPDIIDGVKLSIGDRILLPIRSIHRSEDIWRHPAGPDAFVPERFLEEDKSTSSQALLTFGGGLRRCFGQNLALFHLKVFIVRSMQQLSFYDAPGNNGGTHHSTSGFPKQMVIYITYEGN
ncbi:unnamed protein product [Adineta steineri]|uniref:Cytochrome P450 n=1 Tax=Adineta steineri TaxID=433720 RepID=A0A818V3J4_9BILA|nr:unnamed protein product [Adineta steineri]CAF3705535.1 unnamed protein product [Adineta steineri]